MYRTAFLIFLLQSVFLWYSPCWYMATSFFVRSTRDLGFLLPHVQTIGKFSPALPSKYIQNPTVCSLPELLPDVNHYHPPSGLYQQLHNWFPSFCPCSLTVFSQHITLILSKTKVKYHFTHILSVTSQFYSEDNPKSMLWSRKP